jgi:hypothetical protein
MARRCKSLVAPEQGYAHRDHRSRKTRSMNAPYQRLVRKRTALDSRKKRVEMEATAESLRDMPAVFNEQRSYDEEESA